MSQVLIVDGNNLIYRTYYVASSLSNEQQAGMLAVHMFMSALKNYCLKYRPSRVVCCWDKRKDGVANYRASMASDYKGNRDKDNAQKVHANNHIIEDLLNSLGIANFYPGELEADDCIAYLCDKFESDNIVIVSGDKDLYQLVDNRIVIYSPIKKIEVNLSNFADEAGFDKADFLTAKCLMGDKSDNVTGVRGFGPKTVEKFLAGKIVLTEDQQMIFDHNKKLFALDLYKTHPGEFEYYESQALSGEYDGNKYEAICKENNLKNLLSSKDAYFDLFCMPSKLLELFA